uniref:tRNA-synt_1c domain-containing protein n=1 Tax=Heterorhabditis bacteriophora TaxID=37862 RepID=A0A1I7XFY3_HETBA
MNKNAIHRVLDQYGLQCDEGPRIGGEFGPYEQSSRLNLYRKRIQQLIDTNHAYRCFCSESRLALLRKDALRQNTIPKYDRRCRDIDIQTSQRRAESGESFVVRFKTDKQDVTFKDEVYGIVTQSLDESDMVLIKSDGFPTYHFANVVDDEAMKISHVNIA